MKKKFKIFLHKFFEFSLIIKGLDGILDLIFGSVLLFSATNPIAKALPFLFRRELIEDPADRLANWLVGASQNITHDTATFIALYLLIHGLVKISLTLALLSKHYRLYQIAGVVLLIFISYQIYRFAHTHSIALLLVTIYDIIILSLIYPEAKNLKPKTINA